MQKNKNSKSKKEKIYDFLYKNRKTIILCSFVISFILFFLSIVFSNKGGLYVLILYPLALVGFILDLKMEHGWKYIRFSLSFIASTLIIIMFILGFFIEI